MHNIVILIKSVFSKKITTSTARKNVLEKCSYQLAKK